MSGKGLVRVKMGAKSLKVLPKSLKPLPLTGGPNLYRVPLFSFVI